MFQKVDSAVGLIQRFEKDLKAHAMHEFKIRHQLSAIRAAKDNLKDDELLIHVDFSENYSCKRGEEVQAAHFGNRPQVTIHQGVCYRTGSSNGFVTLSDDRRKSAVTV